jgi:LacI family transcriptional regulator
VNQQGVGTRVAEKPAPRRRNQNGWRVIGLLLPDIANAFFIEITEAIEYTALQRGYQLLLCNSRHQPSVEEMHLRQLAEQGVVGVILAHDPHAPFPQSASLLEQAKIPYVALFSSQAEALCDTVTVDDIGGVNQMMRYLYSLGHRRIAFCRPIPGDEAHPREKAYLDFMARNGCPVPPHFLIPYRSLEDDAGAEVLARVLDSPAVPTAFFAGNDRTALLLMRRLAALGVRVPQDVSVAGFDNLRFTEDLPVPLTTVDQPKQEMGRRAAELLLERIELGISAPARAHVFEPHLVIRESCAVPRPPLAGQEFPSFARLSVTTET